MESEKENVLKKPFISRIPVPLDPLPPLPKHLFRTKNTGKIDIVRKPLGTIIRQGDANAAGSSSTNIQKSNEKPEKKIPILKIDTKNVTMRHKNEYLDWDLNIFKDLDETITSNNEGDPQETKDIQIPEDVPKFSGEYHLAVTPAIPIEHKGVKNIKKSLKRPHSRELQGISTAVNQDENRDEKVKRRLQFNEKIHERLQSPDRLKRSYMTCLTRDYTTDIFEYLLSVEKKPLGVPKSTSMVRACVVNWLVKVNGPNGNPAIIQSAVWYFDSILSIDYIPVQKLQLLAAACYWIAQKLHGPVTSAKRLVKASNNAFTAEQLQTAEKRVFMKLKFPIQPVVPQEFITYLSWWCDQAHPGPIEVAATFLCLSGLMVDKIICEEFPSVIAASAVKNALLLTGKNDLLDQLEVCPVYQAAEKKTSSMLRVSSILRSAVRTMSSASYEYDTPLEHYGRPPHCTAQIISKSVAELAVYIARHVTMNNRHHFDEKKSYELKP